MDSSIMSTPRWKNRPSRKKACIQCARSKVRCNLQRPACARCVAAKNQCKYAAPPDEASSPLPTANVASRQYTPHVGVASPVSLTDTLGPSSTPGSLSTWVQPSTHGATPRNQEDSVQLHLVNPDSIPLDDADQIRHRWVRQFLDVPEQNHKEFQPYTLQFISSVLRTYSKQMMDDNGVPPFIHPAQITGNSTSIALANCYSLVRMWHNRVPMSEDVVTEAVQREMSRLEHTDTEAGHFDALAAFQAYLIYSIMAYFSPVRPELLINDSTMMTLQELAFRTAQSGLLLRCEASHSQPDWESWIMVAAKRRALFAFYLLSSVYNANNQVPNLLAEELREVYVPDAKRLWAATTRREWEREYRRHLCRWEEGGPLRISELWRSQETGTQGRRDRIDRWVETADEFGMMLFAVCVHIHGY